MTPTEALAQALSDQKHAVLFEPDDFAAHIAAALDALGYTVARTQDAADGEALARLRQAMNPSDGLLLALTSRGVVQASVAVIPAEHRGIGDPVSKAADACRAQLESAAIEATR